MRSLAKGTGTAVLALSVASAPVQGVELVQDGGVDTLRFEGPGGILSVVPEEVAGVSLADGAGGPAVALALAPGAAEGLAALTAAGIGAPLAVSVCGVEMMRPEVRAVVTDGLVVVAVPHGTAAVTVMEVLSGAARCEAVRGRLR